MIAITFSVEAAPQARLRLEQSKYFLEKLAETSGEGPAFAFLLHALVSSTRSVTLILQKDLRSKHSDTFDNWWRAEEANLEDDLLPFAVLRELRNTFEKEGSILPMRFYELTLDEGPVAQVHYMWAGYASPPEPFPPHVIASTLVKSGMLASQVDFRSDDPMVLEIAGQAAADANHRNRGVVKMTELSRDTANRMQRQGLHPRFAGYCLSAAGGNVYTFDEVVRAFRSYIDRLSAMLDRADSRFPFEPKIGVHPHFGDRRPADT